MHNKALIIGARPSPWEGPWIELGDGTWLVNPMEDYQGAVAVEVTRPDSDDPDVLSLNDEPVQIEGIKARGIIRDEITEFDFQSVSVELRQVG